MNNAKKTLITQKVKTMINALCIGSVKQQPIEILYNFLVSSGFWIFDSYTIGIIIINGYTHATL